MKAFEHYTARTLKEASTILSRYAGKAKVNAGGTDLIGALKHRCLATYPEAVINIKTIEDLAYIKKEKRGIRIGALTRLADIVESPEIARNFELLVEATKSVASPNVRNMATIGGNLAQDVRCWYYRYPWEIGGAIICLRKGGSLCNALLGDNRYHSIFGASPLEVYPCAEACPGHVNIPKYMGEVRKGRLQEAARIILDSNPIPAITGRVCPAYCESTCNRNTFDGSVGIRCVERAIGDYILERAEEFYLPPSAETGKRVGIVGSGPAGLSAAFFLRRLGYSVTVFERLEKPGGMLLFSIPPYRLPKGVVERQVDALKKMGIVFEVGVHVGKDLKPETLARDFEALIFCGGTWSSLKLGVNGEACEGVFYALDYLKSLNSGRIIPLGEKVVVVGGGSVAFDVARVAKRLGSRDVHIVCLESRDLTSKDRIVALDEEILSAEEEGITIHPSLGVTEILTREGRAVGVSTVRCTSVREPDGTFSPRYDYSSAGPTIGADSVLIAIGQTQEPDLISIIEQIGIPVFVAGDMELGPSTVIRAIGSARKAVRALASGLGEREEVEERRLGPFVETSLSLSPRVEPPRVAVQERLRGIGIEEVGTISTDEASEEAKRCFNCGCLAVEPSDIAVALVALDATIVTTKRRVKAQDFFRSTATRCTILDPDEIIKEVFIPFLSNGARQKFLKFTLREPIDFSIVSVATILHMKEGVCKKARIVLGAVAPEPVRSEEAERVLVGRKLDKMAAEEAAVAALRNSLPLSKNAYKIEIAKAMIRRAILGSG